MFSSCLNLFILSASPDTAQRSTQEVRKKLDNKWGQKHRKKGGYRWNYITGQRKHKEESKLISKRDQEEMKNQQKQSQGRDEKVEKEIKWQEMKRESRVEGAWDGHCRVMAYNSHSLFYEPLLSPIDRGITHTRASTHTDKSK